ncbi:MAG: hypothetical protein KDA60_14135, partial [Planctomycetales bacterium]|nr:hypothetical protein [Planctomycetales bacterium]
NGPTGGKNSDAESVVKYKLLRFFDFKSPLKPGSSYVYRVRLKLEDPNNPYDASQRPASRSLDASVADRLAREASTLAVGETHKFWRTSPNSAPSNPVLIQEASHIVMGKVTAPLMIVSRSGDLKIPSFGEEHVVGIVARRFDNDIKAIKSGYVETKRGGVADFVKGRIRVDDPLTADAQILEDGEIDTGTIVIDITGGEEIRETDLNAPGAVLLWNSDGSLDVRFELEDAPKFKELGLANADEEEEKRGRDRGRDRSTSERDERRDRENERRTRGAERNRPRRPPPENADILGEGR